MENTAGAAPLVIGLTGSFGSGCTYIADNILSNNGYSKISLSKILKDLFEEEKQKQPEKRYELQDFGDFIRETKGPEFLARKAIQDILSGPTDTKWVVDSIRNPREVQCLRDKFPHFYLIGIFADKETRWDRVKAKGGLTGYNNDHTSFNRDDERDTGNNSPSHGQRVSDCFYEADILFRNEKSFHAVGNAAFVEYQSQFLEHLKLVQEPLSNKQATRKDVTIMAMAYAIAQRSSCRQRKVGAIITDKSDNIISSGFNEVPPGESTCTEEYKKCYRELCRENFFNYLSTNFKERAEKNEDIEKEFKKHFRVLDLCRALHAEENAILNLARHGRSALAEECTLYTTTYPCRLCANKIAQLGIKKVVYLEPYPDPETKLILENNDVTTEFFEGITFRSYFRVYGEQK